MRPPDAPPPRRRTGADGRITLGEVQRAKRNPLAGLKPIPCQCWPCRLDRAADKAIDTNEVAYLDAGLVVVPDTIMAEAAANGLETPDTYRAVRGDGRGVWLFRRAAS